MLDQALLLQLGIDAANPFPLADFYSPADTTGVPAQPVSTCGAVPHSVVCDWRHPGNRDELLEEAKSITTVGILYTRDTLWYNPAWSRRAGIRQHKLGEASSASSGGLNAI